MVKAVAWIVLIVVVVVLFGTWPLGVLSKIFEWTADAVKAVAKLLDFFHWNGMLKIGGGL